MNRDPAIVALREALEQRLEAMADAATERIVLDVPAYRGADEQFRADIRAHVVAHLHASLESLNADREVTREDLLFVRPHAARRAKRSRSPSSCRRSTWANGCSGTRARARARRRVTESRAGVRVAPAALLRGRDHARRRYLETQEQLAATGKPIRRDLLEDLLAGRELEPGPRVDSARAAGLTGDSAFVVISATPYPAPDDEQLLRGGAAALARAIGGRTVPLAVVRQDEIVVVVPAVDGDAEMLTTRLTDVQQRLADAGLPLAVAVSTAVSGLAQIPEAYRESSTIRIARGSAPGVVALSELSAFEYLTLRADPTTGRLIPSAVHEFVAQDMADGGPLIATLREYVACDLNARRAADNLHIHVNTAHYRLSRIAERTGYDLRSVSDLIEILIAARLADAELVASHNRERPN